MNEEENTDAEIRLMRWMSVEQLNRYTEALGTI
jgi:hypothetical protein